MIINHHFRVELKAHTFNLSIVNKRFSHPVIFNLTSHFFISSRPRSLSADSQCETFPHKAIISSLITVDLHHSETISAMKKQIFFHVEAIPKSPFMITRGSDSLLPTIKTDKSSCCLAQVPQRVLSRPCLLGPLLEKPSRTSR